VNNLYLKLSTRLIAQLGRCAVDTMQSVCLKEASVSSPLAEETTLVGYTFGGYLRSKVVTTKDLFFLLGWHVSTFKEL